LILDYRLSRVAGSRSAGKAVRTEEVFNRGVVAQNREIRWFFTLIHDYVDKRVKKNIL